MFVSLTLRGKKVKHLFNMDAVRVVKRLRDGGSKLMIPGMPTDVAETPSQIYVALRRAGQTAKVRP